MSLTFGINVVINTTFEFELQMMITVSIALYLIWKRKSAQKIRSIKAISIPKTKINLIFVTR